MEAVVGQISARESREFEEARKRLDAYLRASRLPEHEQEEITAMVIAYAELRFKEERAQLLRVIIEEAQRLMLARLNSPGADGLAFQTQRPAETYPMTMETSLSRLPSFRMIGGWFVIVVLLVLGFIFTR